MLIILFFYGLAFILMGVVIFSMPKRNDFLGIADDLWLIGLFGISHGVNEWIDLFILWRVPINIGILKISGGILLPISFLFLVAFGGRVISKRIKQLGYLKDAWIAVFAIWALSSAASNSIQIAGIFARYLICLPGIIISVLGLSIATKGCRDSGTPKTICVSTQIAIAALLLYGIFSGFITPKADFFPASLINYDNFTEYIGVPVQLFRMIIAIVLTISFFCITGLFDRRKNTILVTGGIRRKTGLAIAITTAITLIISISTIYVAGFFVIKKSAGFEQFEITKALALTAAENIKGEIEDIETYASRLLWIEACEDSNRKYAGMNTIEIEKEMLDVDKRWVAANDEDDLIKKCTSGQIADSMREIIRIREAVSEIFITNRLGGLIYASDRTSDFYQADEDWWQKTYNKDKGAIYFGPMEYDDSSGKWGVTIAAPIVNRNKKIVGVCKVFIRIERLFDFLKAFKLGITGHGLLVDDSGVILVHKNIPPGTTKLMDPGNFAKLKNSAYGYISPAFGAGHDKNSFLSICSINSKILRDNGIKWNVAISQNLSEALELLNTFLLTLLFVTIFFVPLTIPIGFFLGGVISKPIDKLSRIADLIASGDLDQKIDIRTGDEIEQFAETFRNMVFAIKASQTNLLTAKKNLEQLIVNQEGLIEDRTAELSRAQEATLNILEDLIEAKGKLEKYARDLEDAVRIKTDFTATVSHELRTPLAAIKEGIAIVLDGTAGPIETKQKEFLEISRRNVDRLTRLINDLLDFQKLDAGRMEFDIVKNDINRVVKETAVIMSTVAQGKDLEIKLDLDNGLPTIEFDKDRIEQVLANLISNAIRYTDKGSITLSTEKKDNFIKVSIKDTGVGIKKEDIPKLFQRFSQLEPVSDRRMGGTGLGLAISKEIIDFHKGKITAESEPGTGSTFSFILPIQERRGAT
ncbi:MAG: ATP-binding protein [Candidatus Omnitrophica bacterium]|nr:ATP-binding protein [Candidatus Omnitrophota bacterium]